MKKIYLSALLAIAAISAGAQCTIDTTAISRPGIKPSPDSISCIERTVAFSQTLQVMCPTTYDSVIQIPIVNTTYPLTVTVDSMQLTAVNGLPNGITWTTNPAVLKGGQIGCISFSGTTGDSVGPYNLGWYGTVWTHVQIIGAKTYTGNLNKYNYVNYYFNVINPGDSCVHFSSWPAGINEANAELSSAFQVYPNPNNGSFEISLNASKSIKGEVEITDITGRTIYTQSVSANGSYTSRIDLSYYSKGLYIIRLRTADGFAAKTISID